MSKDLGQPGQSHHPGQLGHPGQPASETLATLDRLSRLSRCNSPLANLHHGRTRRTAGPVFTLTLRALLRRHGSVVLGAPLGRALGFPRLSIALAASELEDKGIADITDSADGVVVTLREGAIR